MLILDRLFRYTIYTMTIVVIGMVIGQVCNRNKKETHAPVLMAPEPKPIEMLKADPAKLEATPSGVQNNKHETLPDRLKRFDAFRSKVLLRDGEAKEKQHLLADLKSVQAIESELSASPANGNPTTGDRLEAIDFLEEALAWKDNPIRNEVLDSVERSLKANNLLSGSREAKQMAAGDKMELFAILADQDPNRTRVLLEQNKDKQLLGIFQYAIKRLALQNILGEER